MKTKNIKSDSIQLPTHDDVKSFNTSISTIVGSVIGFIISMIVFIVLNWS